MARVRIDEYGHIIRDNSEESTNDLDDEVTPNRQKKTQIWLLLISVIILLVIIIFYYIGQNQRRSDNGRQVSSVSQEKNTSINNTFHNSTVNAAPTNRKTQTPRPTQVPRYQVIPRNYTTQNFKDGVEGRVSYMFDDSINTSFMWIIYRSERTDNIPEITVYFDNDTVGSMWIRNGNMRSEKNYNMFTRIVKMTVKVYQASGHCDTFAITIPDYFTTDYKKIKFPDTYEHVEKIELYIYWNGIDPKDQSGMAVGTQGYYCYITDISFYNRE